eukprot:2000915-Alexandrium_andersonii.AAC.1
MILGQARADPCSRGCKVVAPVRAPLGPDQRSRPRFEARSEDRYRRFGRLREEVHAILEVEDEADVDHAVAHH